MRYLIPVVMLLTGCATSPNAIRDSYDPFATLSLDNDVEVVAECARGVLANEPPNGLNPPRPMLVERPPGVSLLGNASDGTVYVVDFEPGAAVVYVSYAYAAAGRNGDVVVEATRRCD